MSGRAFGKFNRQLQDFDASLLTESIPHFHANVLSGIEYFVMNNSAEEASYYLKLYSDFTNRTLSDIERPARTVAEEVDYVRGYLELEKLRYGDRLHYNINVAPDVDRNLLLPTMLLHTYCQNAVKHGIAAKNGVGTVEVKGKDRVTILDAIAQSGDLTQDAKLDHIAVIREENGKRRVHHVDIRSKSIFDSPVFYLKQNDIIYVEPNDNKVREESRRNMQWIFTGASLITTAISLITLFKK